MFTGIIQAVGLISAVESRGADVRLTIASNDLNLSDVALGDSIAHNGVCLTVISLFEKGYQVDVSRESLNCTTGLEHAGQEVNLEKALRLADRLGGHLVAGHVDGVGDVVRFEPVGECWELDIVAPQRLARYIAAKGSITVNGVSLTTNRVEGNRFSINLIPHTLQNTTLKHLTTGDKVNLEVDLIARYVERMYQPESAA